MSLRSSARLFVALAAIMTVFLATLTLNPATARAQLPFNFPDGYVDLVVNGDFEQGGVGSRVAPTGWTVSGTGGRHESTSRAADGVGYYALDGWGNGRDGVIEQTLVTVPGQDYVVVYSASKHQGAGLAVKLGIEALDSNAVSIGQRTNGVDREFDYSWVFTASTSTSTIRFRDMTTDSGRYDINLDTVIVLANGPAPVSPVEANLVVNGDFELGGVGPGVAPTGWSNSGTGGRHESASRAALGTGYYAMDGWGNGRDGSIEQVLATQPGQLYEMTFRTSKWGNGAIASLSVSVLNGSSVLTQSAVTVDDEQGYLIAFTATGSATTIRFSDVTGPDGGNYDINLDQVYVRVSNFASSAAQLVNGNFEQGGVGPGVAPTGWTITGAGGRHESTSRAAEGTGYYAMGGWSSASDGQLEQTFPTNSGQAYEVQYRTSTWRGADVFTVLRAVALDGSTQIGELQSCCTVGSATIRNFEFTATSANTTIRFIDESSGSGDYDINLDSVSVVALVPELSVVLPEG